MVTWTAFAFMSKLCVMLTLYFLDTVEILLYSPDRPILDSSVSVLWLLAVGTVVCASLWSEITASRKNDEGYNDISPKVSLKSAYSES